MTARLVHYKATSGNVGDDFSDWLFSRYLGERLAAEGDTLLFGVGSILDRGFDKAFDDGAIRRRFVFGSGARSARSVPDVAAPGWTVYCVRGALSASAIGQPEKALADPAILAPRLLPAAGTPAGPVGIVPYFTASHGIWGKVAEKFGWKLVSPHLGVEEFIAALTQCSRVFCESMHGAIFADAYRIPWRPVSGTGISSEGATHAFKWTDWCSGMGVAFDSIKIRPIGDPAPGNALQALKQRAKAELLMRSFGTALKEDRFTLSGDAVLTRQQERLLALMEQMRQDLAA